MKYSIAVIGGGASGLMAAVTAAQAGVRNIIIFEKAPRVGRKLSATGNGQGNLTNKNCRPEYFHSNDLEKAQTIISLFNEENVCAFFERSGLVLKAEENGRVYPHSYQAASITDVLRYLCERLNIVIATETEVKDIAFNKFYKINTNNGNFESDSIIIATGGHAAPQFNTDGSSDKFLKCFGHTYHKQLPSLVQIKTETAKIKGLRGIKADVNVTVCKGENPLISHSGELLFTDYGISGNVVFAVSGAAVREYSKDPDITFVINFMPEYDENSLFTLIKSRIENKTFSALESFFTGIFNKQTGKAVLNASGIDNINENPSVLNDYQIKRIVQNILSFKLKMTGDTGFRNAQTTIGGFCLNEFSGSLQSKKQDGLFACGEILDVDGDCGGYNLQWAWSSGYAAGLGAAEFIKSCKE